MRNDKGLEKRCASFLNFKKASLPTGIWNQRVKTDFEFGKVASFDYIVTLGGQGEEKLVTISIIAPMMIAES